MLSRIGKQFRHPSGILGRIISLLMKKGNMQSYDKILHELEIKDNDIIFEIGYGHGLGIKRILSNNNCYISGIDFSELMYKEATRRNKTFIDDKKLELSLGDFLNFKMKSDYYDKIFCINVVYFWDNLDNPFSKIRDSLKKDGVFCFSMAHRDTLNKLKYTKDNIFNKYTIEQVVDKLNLSGFEEIDYHLNKVYLIKCIK